MDPWTGISRRLDPRPHDLRRAVHEYFVRHAEESADVDGADLAVGELFANLVKHAPGAAWVSLRWSGERVALVVTDLGPGFDPATAGIADPLAEGGRGLLILDAVSEQFDAAARAEGGSRVRAVIALARRNEHSHSPRPSPGGALPDLDEAEGGGGFGKESFLRALVVQLAQSVENITGPAAAEQAVAQVGTDVGGQMEAEYRLAGQVVGRLTPEQVAECLVRLKRAIDGNFRVTEFHPDRIVFENTACPFGDVVRRAPALCRMTSSVFGGIAAHNTESGTAAVYLEERIAVGDPHCRVIVYLGEAPADIAPFAHQYSDASP